LHCIGYHEPGSTSCVSGGEVDSCTLGSPTAEVCNGIDDDCDGEIDNGLELHTYYRNADNDTYGDPDNATVACAPPEGYVDNSTGFDCNDNDSTLTDNCIVCTAKFIPPSISKFLATIVPVTGFIIQGEDGFKFSKDTQISWSTDAVSTLFKSVMGKKKGL